MNDKLIAVTGKCKLKRLNYPVRIYATDCGESRDMIHGAYQDKDGWHACAWDADGSPRFATINNDKALINIPPRMFFNIHTHISTKNQCFGIPYDNLTDAKDAWALHGFHDAELYQKDDDQIKLIATYTCPKKWGF